MKPKPPPLRRSPAQLKKAEEAALGAEQARLRAEAQTRAQAEATKLAQIANLILAGHSLTSIGAAIGATADEVDSMLNRDMARYVRNQPALRVFVRNYISSKYTELLDTNWSIATDAAHPAHLEHQDRVLKTLKEVGKLHGAEAPVQSEVKIEAAPEAVDAIVARLAAGQGLGYDTNIFDVPSTEGPATFTPSPAAAHAALEQAAADVEAPTDPDTDALGLGADDE